LERSQAKFSKFTDSGTSAAAVDKLLKPQTSELKRLLLHQEAELQGADAVRQRSGTGRCFERVLQPLRLPWFVPALYDVCCNRVPWQSFSCMGVLCKRDGTRSVGCACCMRRLQAR
jgi:hypothetical protein